MPARCILLFFLTLILALPAGGFQTPQQQAPQQPPPQEQQKPPDVITFDTNVVVLNVTVTDGLDHYVTGLTAKDFSIFEDQARQRIASFSFNEMPFAAVILLDTSGSMERKMSLARAACTRFVDGIREGDVVAIYGFGGKKVTVMRDFSEVRDVGWAVFDTDPEGMTPLYDGIVKAAEALGSRSERRRAILLVSDGADTQSRASFDEAMRRALAADVAIYGVDLSDAALYHTGKTDNGAEVMKSFAVKSGGRFFRTPGGTQLRDAFAQAVEELRNQYTITYETTNERQDGRWRTIETRVGRPSLTVRTRQGYYAAKKR
jgi:VWFA-related protein